MIKNSTALLTIAFLASAHWAIAAFGFNLDGTLDKPAISKAYFESDFTRILPPLEAWRQGIAESKTREDSIFVFKYLSIVYAANPASKEKSRSFMFQLLTLAPTIEILDMYASDEIERTFHTVKKEFTERKEYMRTHDQLGNKKPKPSTQPVATVRSKDSGRWFWWVVGGVGVAAAVAGGYYVLNDSHEPQNETKGFKP